MFRKTKSNLKVMHYFTNKIVFVFLFTNTNIKYYSVYSLIEFIAVSLLPMAGKTAAYLILIRF